MTIDQSIEIVRQTLTLMLMLSLPILGAALVIGLLVSILQAVTQIQEQTLSFVPKIVGMGVVAIFVAPWLFMKIMEFAAKMFGEM
ncbi:MAG: flagellar biosynthesis protein FliQ [Phycisphaeraceae bacterium]|nr:flagellar biosynthesis protein FliQ [Phycisphaeraceae bacterium]